MKIDLSYNMASGSEITPQIYNISTTSGLQILEKHYDVHNNTAYIMKQEMSQTHDNAPKGIGLA